MLNRLSLLLLVSVLFLTTPIFSQQPAANFVIKGKVIDESTGQPVEFATVAVKRMRDSSLVSGTITPSTGEFRIEGLGPGGYNVEIAFIGYEKFTTRTFFRPQGSAPVADLGVIKLKISATLLKEAEISADKSFVMNNIDKKTYNTEQLAVAAGGNASDVLQNLPSVEADADGNLSLRGNQNVTVLIDGRPSSLTGAGGKSLLESIPASAIEKVEVITNPSAKYDPDGISGIINIITKKNKLQGFTGSVGLNTSFGGRFSGNANLAYRHGKWNVYGIYGFNKDKRTNTGDSYRETYFNDVTSILTQDEDGLNKRISNNAKIGVDYNINDKNTISASGMFNMGNNKSEDNIVYRLFDGSMVQDSIYHRDTYGTGDNQNLDLEMAFRHYFKQEGRVLNVQANASLENSENDNKYVQQGYIDDYTPEPIIPVLQNDKSNDDNKVYTISADYEHPIGKDKKIEAGYKSTFRDLGTDYYSESFNDSLMQFSNDLNLSNNFEYKDGVHAVYAQYRQSLGKFGFQAGVRTEYAQTESKLLTTGQKFSKDYFSVYPSVFVTYKLAEKSQLKVTYSRRVNRPNKRALNPFTDYEDPLNIRRGNPYLNPEYTDSYELEYSQYIGKVSLTSTGYFRWTHDYIQRYRVITPEGINITTFENLKSARNYGLELILNGSPYKWWNFTVSTNMYRNETDATNLESDLSSVAFSWSGRVFTTFKLPYSTDFQISWFYRAPMTVTQGTMKEMQMTTLALSKKVLKDKGVVTLKVSDPLNNQQFGFKFRDDSYYQDFTRKRQSRFVTIGFTYRFGELKDRDQRPRRDQGPKEDMDFGD